MAIPTQTFLDEYMRTRAPLTTYAVDRSAPSELVSFKEDSYTIPTMLDSIRDTYTREIQQKIERHALQLLTEGKGPAQYKISAKDIAQEHDRAAGALCFKTHYMLTPLCQPTFNNGRKAKPPVPNRSQEINRILSLCDVILAKLPAPTGSRGSQKVTPA